MKYKGLLATALVIGAIAAVTTQIMANERKGQSTILHVQEYGKKNAKLNAGMAAPVFSAVDSNGNTFNLADFKGKKNVLLVFYPGDNTPGCTKQLCALRDDYKDLEKLDVKVFGVNPADAESHNKFIKDQKYPFQLLIDKDKKIAQTYDAVGMLGFINRTVVLINKEGKIVLYERGMPDMAPKMVATLIK
jgi:peroxiredoxin Q/BCP